MRWQVAIGSLAAVIAILANVWINDARDPAYSDGRFAEFLFWEAPIAVLIVGVLCFAIYCAGKWLVQGNRKVVSSLGAGRGFSTKTITWIAFQMLLICVPLTVIGKAVIDRKAGTIIASWDQPTDIDYQSYGPYQLYVIEGPRQWNGWFTFHRTQRILVSHHGDTWYGHWKAYSFAETFEDSLDPYIRKSKVEWTPEGVTFVEHSGHRMFIPKMAIIGGR